MVHSRGCAASGQCAPVPELPAAARGHRGHQQRDPLRRAESTAHAAGAAGGARRPGGVSARRGAGSACSKGVMHSPKEERAAIAPVVSREDGPVSEPAAQRRWCRSARCRSDFGGAVAVDRRFARHHARRAVRDPRQLRLRQDDAAAHAGGLRAADLRPHPHRRCRHDRRAAVRAAGQPDVPVVRAVPAHDGVERTSPTA